MIKYIILVLLLTSCFKNSSTEIDDCGIKDLNKKTHKIHLMLRTMDCQLGVVYVFRHSGHLLRNKIPKLELDAIWADCEKLRKE